MKILLNTVLITLGLLMGGCATTTFKMFDDNGTAIRSVADSNYSEEVQFEWKITA